ncbi:bifunctional serine/threonine-protein kinase/formylglycine-generating enzyme family protein [Pleionea sediminis]|uniref:bifunctional serine/threonine-protein kinase/formylglycine-generating enzyme family protein n=1 Tax=Pleionea sediminis TaxID=2569479 RepID=UPI0011864867|nr:bifunctional serine/threonine-protein kinase/formylglycine-generating enzyme family protein [Pleionea sediminis]
MDKQKACKLLGLNDSPTQAEVQSAYDYKRSDIQSKANSAPTDALKEKFLAVLTQLDQARQLLIENSKKPLTQTKLADLPEAAPIGSQTANKTEFKIDEWIADRYQIKSLIGQGGMGMVYSAYDKARDETVALKFLAPAISDHSKARERFINEARLSSQLSHPAIINVYDVQQKDDLVFLSMELLEGSDLRAKMDERQLKRQPYQQEEAEQLLKTLCDALEHAHQKTVHRDLKPENIWVTQSGDYKIMDFGIARVVSTSQRTKTGSAMGTAYYMAPEQLKRAESVDGRADIYSIGIILYELLTGDIPAGRYKPLKKARPDISKKLASIIDQCLEPDPQDRFHDISELKAQLDKRSINFSGLNKKLLGGIAATLVIAAAATFIVLNPEVLNQLKALLPDSETDTKAQYTQALRLDGQVKDLREQLAELEQQKKRELDTIKNDTKRLATKLSDSTNRSKQQTIRRDLELAKTKEQNTQYIFTMLDEYVFNGPFIRDLRGEDRLAEGLLRDKNYADAITTLEKLSEGYQRLINSTEGASTFVNMRKLANDAYTQAKNATRTYNLGNTPQIKSLEESKKSAEKLANEVKFDLAANKLAELKGASEQFTRNIASYAKAKENASKSRSAWTGYAKKQSLLNLKESQELERLYKKTISNAEQGLLTEATQALNDLNNEYSGLLDSAKNSKTYYSKSIKAKSNWESFLKQSNLKPHRESNDWTTQLTSAKAVYDKGNIVEAGLKFRDIEKKYNAQLNRDKKQYTNLKTSLNLLETVCQIFSIKPGSGFLEKECNLVRKHRNGIDYLLSDLSSQLNQFQSNKSQWEAMAVDLEKTQYILSQVESKINELSRYKNDYQKLKTQLASLTPLLAAKNLTSAQNELRKIVQQSDSFLKNVRSTLAAQSISMDMKSIDNFKIASKEVTVADFRKFVDATNYQTDAEKPGNDGCWGQVNRRWGYSRRINWRTPGFSQQPSHPVVCVSYRDAQAFIQWLNQETKRQYRLPSESEFEIAAKSGTTSKFYWGNTITPGKANCQGCGRKSSNIFTVAVASFPPNRFGLYDMLGNVWEITDNCWSNSKSSQLASKTGCNAIVAKGGGWNSDPNYILAGSRTMLKVAGQVKADIGFRIAE